MTGWALLFWVAITFLLLYPLNRWINTHVQGVAFLLTGSANVAIWFFWVLFLPGTFLHELSHWLAATLLGVKTSKFSVWPKKQRGGELQMGAVQVHVSDPFRHSLIGLAPLIFGSAAVLIIGYGLLGLQQLGDAVLLGDLTAVLQALADTLAVPDVWLWIYLIFAISNAMLPSASDREAWYSALMYLGLATILAVGLGFNPSIPELVQNFALYALTYLLMAFSVTLILDLIVMAILFIAEWLLGFIIGRGVQYG
jgi:hypothetical protein